MGLCGGGTTRGDCGCCNNGARSRFTPLDGPAVADTTSKSASSGLLLGFTLAQGTRFTDVVSADSVFVFFKARAGVACDIDNIEITVVHISVRQVPYAERIGTPLRVCSQPLGVHSIQLHPDFVVFHEDVVDEIVDLGPRLVAFPSNFARRFAEQLPRRFFNDKRLSEELGN